MSQVVVTQDALQKARDASLAQENKIDNESAFQHWRMSDATKTHPVAKLIGIAVLPIMGLWAFLVVGVSFAMSLIVTLMRVMGRIIPKQK